MKSLAVVILGILLSAPSWAAGATHSAPQTVPHALPSHGVGMPKENIVDPCPPHLICAVGSDAKLTKNSAPAAKAGPSH